MKNTFVNQVSIEGILYDANLEAKITGANSKSPNTPYIRGYLSIAVDDNLSNIVRVYYQYVTPTIGGKNGGNPSPNSQYIFLKNVIDGKVNTYIKDGIDNATRISIPRGNITVNEYYSNRSGSMELHSEPRYRGGFINVLDSLNPNETARNLFECDVIFTSGPAVIDTPDGSPKAKIKGCIHDYNAQGAVFFPMEFVINTQQGIDYFEAADYPLFTKIYGSQESEIVTKKVETAFGDEELVIQDSNNRKEFVIKTAIKEPYTWDDESTITVDEFNAARKARNEVYLPNMKSDAEARANAPKVAAAPTVGVVNPQSSDNFDF